MMKYRIVSRCLLNALLFLLLFTSCEVLDKEPQNAVPEIEVWNNEELATAFLNNLYYLVMPDFVRRPTSDLFDETADLCDESFYFTTDDEYTGYEFLYGLIDNDAVGAFGRETYSYIRLMNMLFENIDNGTLDEETRNRIKGQAYFLRAWTYWNLVKLYGGVPMIYEVQTAFTGGDIDEGLYVKRNKTIECIGMIIADLDSAYEYLPVVWENKVDYGRVTRGAAIALKGRILLFWASPQFNPDNITGRWQWAYDVNKTALESLASDGYGLHPSFEELFNDCMEKTIEAIFVRVYDHKIPGNYYHGYDNAVRPPVETSGGGKKNHVTWAMVQAFPMASGYPLHTDSALAEYNQNRFWLKRDPRFYFTIAYNTCSWPLSGNADYKLWTYYQYSGSSLVSILGNNKTYTGFYCKKYVNPAIDELNTTQVGTDWMEIRFAEVLLNFAECANELDGKTEEVREALYRIRNERDDVKVGMGYIDQHLNDREIMREIIMTERQVELAFENKRHWDLRRRNMYEEDLGPNIKKLNGTRRCGWKVQLNEARVTQERFMTIRDGLDFSQAIVYNAYFLPGKVDTLDTQYAINFPQPKYNFYPFQDENTLKNPELEQNIYWGGTFDPYEE
ncbi:MAG: RagB/SusD family nutrient uptake outer membrane protein [Bacteroidales bacterium]|nr:RagB/SusD family nutrient uptake outer membrane protein [Bacteroidales bacterium]